MSEKQHIGNHERHVFNYESPKELHKELQQSPELDAANNKNQQNKIEQLLEAANEHAKSSESIVSKTENVNESSHHYYVTKHIKQDAYKQTLARTRKKLTKSDKTFSKIVHQKNIESISEVAANTVANPSGILGGGIVAFFGSSIVLFISRKIGFEVPPSIFIALFIVGFIVGFIIEKLLFKFVFKKSSLNRIKSY